MQAERSNLEKHDVYPQNGIVVKRGANGIQKMGKLLMQNANGLLISANIVANLIKANRNMAENDFVPMVADHMPAKQAALMTNVGYVSDVGPHSNATVMGKIDFAIEAVQPLTIIHIEKLDREQAVYNLSVDAIGEYYANGILVSNCDALRYLLWGMK